MNELFPLGVATGKAFLDRDAERSRLHANINTGIHTWLSAPRRYGKTSLVTQVTLELQRGRRRSAQRVRTATVDLLVCHDAGTVETATLHAVGRILGDILPARAKVAAYLRQTFKNVAAELVMAADGPRVRFRITTGQTIALTEALLGLDQVAADHGHRAVVIIDEFQQLSGFKAAGRGIEGAIRHAAQSARCVSYVFMGSERGLLSQQFEQPDRPLYMLCERLILDRIPAEPYRAYLKRASKLQWSKAIDRDVQNRILTRTERHPYYLNTLCRELWRADEAPNATVVDQTWERYVDSERAPSQRCADAFESKSAGRAGCRREISHRSALRPRPCRWHGARRCQL